MGKEGRGLCSRSEGNFWIGWALLSGFLHISSVNVGQTVVICLYSAIGTEEDLAD